MKISPYPPPNYQDLKKLFPNIDFFDKNANTVITLGDTIHSNKRLRNDMLVHEIAHIIQQKHFKGGVDEWIRLCEKNRDYFLEIELEAYQAQYLYLSHVCDARSINDELDRLARDLSGPIYGYLVDFDTAKKLISNQ